MKGKLITFYGINNLGKSTQAKLLEKKMIEAGRNVVYYKYPFYDLPSGKILNSYLREGNPFNLTPREVQTIYAFNRQESQHILKDLLDSGIDVIAEDYAGTGICWGIGAGVDKKYLELINYGLIREDLAFLFDGERFKEATEKGHKHETDEDLLEKVRQAHLKIGEERGWIKVNANLTIDKIHGIIWEEIKKHLN